jgi:phage gpG-like protein
MSDTGLFIKVTGTEETLRGLDKRQHALRAATVKSLRLASEVVLRRATENVRGKVLNVDRGALWQRLSYHIFADQGISKIGSPVVYAPAHEFGTTIQHPGGTAYYFDERKNRTVFLSNEKAGAHNFPRTKPHAVPMPARPWLRPALADSKADIEAIFRKGAQEALGESPETGGAA